MGGIVSCQDTTNTLCISVALDDLLVGRDPLGDLGVGLDVGGDLLDGLGLLVVGLALDLALGLKGSHDVLVLPSDVVRQAAKGAELEGENEDDIKMVSRDTKHLFECESELS